MRYLIVRADDNPEYEDHFATRAEAEAALAVLAEAWDHRGTGLPHPYGIWEFKNGDQP